MPGSDDQIEEWQRIRDRQIAARDPDAARNKRYQRVHQRHKNANRSLSFQDIMKVISWKLIGGVIGFILGLLAWVVISKLVVATWVNLAGIGVCVLLTGLGVLIGASFDWRDNLRDF